MEWLIKLMQNPMSIAHIMILYALVISLGVKLGRWKIGGKKNGIAFGVTWVLFVGIIVGHICTHGLYADPAQAVADQKPIIDLVKELGLILFVYCIGLQVGPSFFEVFKGGGGGVKMNLLAVGIVLLNVIIMLCLWQLGKSMGVLTAAPITDVNGSAHDGNLPMMVGVMYGAVTNTPGLGAANGVLAELFGDVAPAIANGYACAYPLGVVGIILATIAIRFLTGTSLQEAHDELKEGESKSAGAKAFHMAVRVTNAPVVGRKLHQLHDFLNRQFVVTRCFLENGEVIIANGETELQLGMEVHITCAEDEAEAISALIGEIIPRGQWTEAEENTDTTDYVSQRLVITKPEINGKTFADLHISTYYNVNVTRVTRNGMELFAARDLRLMVGDRLLINGRKENVDRVRDLIGANVKHLDHPNVGAIFFGILVGVLVGQLPIPIPGVEIPVKLGLAGGPLVVAILIGAFGYRFKINTYTSSSANMLLREVGLILFLSSVGIQAGAKFVDTVTAGDGVHYIWMGFLITVVPLLIMGVVGRKFMKLNYFTLMGLIAGSNTDPPALAFANATAGNNAPAVGYSTVYPLSMFLRILMAQLVLIFFL
ncbi:MAG: putative transporter [Bacteroidales bacterium]|nr:putative transporter [Bacteroidales bacterium]